MALFGATRFERLAGRPGEYAHLLQHPCDVYHRPVFNDLAVADTVNRNAFGLDTGARGV
jgi:hypothetical protein